MPTIEKAIFVPNCVLIPPAAVWHDRRGEHVDPAGCTLLMLAGDNNYGEIFTRQEWENDGMPSFFRRYFEFMDGEDGQIPSETGRLELLLDLNVVKIDERDYWLDPFVLSRTKRLFGVYVFDRRQHIHVCSVTPSHELHFLGSQWEPIEGLSDSENEELWDRISQGDTQSEPVTYWDKYDIDQMLKYTCREGFLPEGNGGGFRLTGIVSVMTGDAIEEAREAYQASEF